MEGSGIVRMSLPKRVRITHAIGVGTKFTWGATGPVVTVVILFLWSAELQVGGIASQHVQFTHGSGELIDLLLLAVGLLLIVVDLLLEVRPDLHGHLATPTIPLGTDQADEQRQEEAAF